MLNLFLGRSCIIFLLFKSGLFWVFFMLISEFVLIFCWFWIMIFVWLIGLVWVIKFGWSSCLFFVKCLLIGIIIVCGSVESKLCFCIFFKLFIMESIIINVIMFSMMLKLVRLVISCLKWLVFFVC